MITEPSTAVAPSEIYENIENVHQQVDALQRELAQATEVWKSTLAGEKEQFDTLLARKDMAAREQDGQWAAQSAIFEERLAQMRSDFEVRLMQAEQNAARALSEIDDAWQRDKLEWGPQAQSQWPLQRAELETKVRDLEAKVTQLEAERVQQAAQPTSETVMALEKQLLEFQETVAQLQSRSSQSDELVNACVQALDYQISVLYDLIHHHAEPATPEATDLAEPQ